MIAPVPTPDGTPADVQASPEGVKVVIAGGFGVGKTTFVHTASEIAPLSTEAAVSIGGAAVDDAEAVTGKSMTTVVMDFGRITLGGSITLYLFGTPGQDRFGFMWDDLVQGAIGAVVLVDSRRLEASFAALDYFEHQQLPFVVAVNCFGGQLSHPPAEIRDALALRSDVPLLAIDARDHRHARDVLVGLLERVIEAARAAA